MLYHRATGHRVAPAEGAATGPVRRHAGSGKTPCSPPPHITAAGLQESCREGSLEKARTALSCRSAHRPSGRAGPHRQQNKQAALRAWYRRGYHGLASMSALTVPPVPQGAAAAQRTVLPLVPGDIAGHAGGTGPRPFRTRPLHAPVEQDRVRNVIGGRLGGRAAQQLGGHLRRLVIEGKRPPPAAHYQGADQEPDES